MVISWFHSYSPIFLPNLSPDYLQTRVTRRVLLVEQKLSSLSGFLFTVLSTIGCRLVFFFWKLNCLSFFELGVWLPIWYLHTCLKGILSTKIVIFSYPKLLSSSVLTFIKWRLTPSYAAKDTIFWQKRPKTIVIGIIVKDNKNSNLFIWPSMWTRLEHAHCLETINNKWALG